MTQQELINLIWSIANKLRGPYRPPQYRKVMIPLTVLRRLDCVLEPTKEKVLAEYKELKARKMDEKTIEATICRRLKLPFYNTSRFTFAKLLGDPDKLAANLVAYIKGFSGATRQILERFEFDAEIEKLDKANRLFEIVKTISAVDLHPNKVPNTAMGHVFEELVRKFNEQANEEAGDHFTPREVIRLMVHLIFSPDDDVFTQKGAIRTLYDPCCGTGGMLTVADEYVREHAPGLTLKVFGQEYNEESHAICGSDMIIKGDDASNIVFGDTLGDGKSRDGFPDHKFHYMLANPPFGVEWKPQADSVEREHADLGFSGRFGPGLPRINDGALLFLLHMISKRRKPEDGGTRIGIVFNGSPLFTGDAGSGESDIRRWIIENDWLEAIVGLPDQMFYNTGILTYIWIVSNRKEPHRRGKVQLIDATSLFQKMRKSLGDKRNEMSPEHIAEVTRMYAEFTEGEHVRIYDNRAFGYIKLTVEQPLRLNFQADSVRVARLPKESAFAMLAESRKRKSKLEIEAEQEAGRREQAAIINTLNMMEGRIVYRSRPAFIAALNEALAKAGLMISAQVHKAIVNALSERDDTADVCRANDAPDGPPEPDTELRDAEYVPLPSEFPIPAPIEFGRDADNSRLVDLVRDHCARHLKSEVLPFVPDVWIDHKKTRIGFEICVNRCFYKPSRPRDLSGMGHQVRAIEELLAVRFKELAA